MKDRNGKRISIGDDVKAWLDGIEWKKIPPRWYEGRVSDIAKHSGLVVVTLSVREGGFDRFFAPDDLIVTEESP